MKFIFNKFTTKTKNVHQKTAKNSSVSTSTKLNKKIFVIYLVILICINLTIIFIVLGSVNNILKVTSPIKAKTVSPKGFKTTIYDQNNKIVKQLSSSNSNREYVSLKQIPLHLQYAFIVIEDERFWKHKGIDFKGIFRAILVNIKQGNFKEGASTLTQQLIKNNTLTVDKTFNRKIKEQYLAIQLEKKLSKKTILEYYLNTIALGKNTKGVQSASRLYFDKSAKDLTIAESAVIASITKAPTSYNPIDHPDKNLNRKNIILKKLLENGYITNKEYNLAKSEDIYKHIQEVKKKKNKSGNYNSYFVDTLVKQVVTDLMAKLNITEKESINLLYNGGLKIYSTQDLNIQQIVDKEILNEKNYPPKTINYGVKLDYKLSVEKSNGEIIHHSEQMFKKFFMQKDKKFSMIFNNKQQPKKYIDEYKRSVVLKGDHILAENIDFIPQPQISFSLIDYHTGQVKAISGGRGEKKGSFTFNRATEAIRQPGSTFKILAAFLPAIDIGKMTLSSILDDVPYWYKDGRLVSNWYTKYKGLSTLREAVAYSMNVCAVKALTEIGTLKGYDYLKKFGFTTLEENDKYSQAQALGGITKGVTNLELTAAYSAIANNGVYIEPIYYTKITDKNGQILVEKKQTKKRIMKKTTSFLITSAMDINSVPDGTAKIVNFNNGVKMPISGKTGTTNKKYDLWFSGYTPYYTASIWMGHDRNTELNLDKPYHKLIWRNIMQKIHKNLSYKQFNRPKGIVKAKICTESGKLATTLCKKDKRNTIRDEFFTIDTVPTEKCDVHKLIKVCSDSNLPPSQYCPEEKIVKKLFIVRPKKIDRATWNTLESTPIIEDTKYEFSCSLNEVCNIHKPLDIESIFDFDNWLDNNTDDDNDIIDSDDTNDDDSVNNNYNLSNIFDNILSD